ncbi:MAG: hypothetical protein GWN84_02870 [Gammaproteobacteria bacterium]|nr:hypothetical protein [Gammaproteobacteria bacterium]NIR82090.1 hypothetical protein [Gammaproteobacteria bacterium]NIR89323.1 hypothetical protein [Gammaproteobacteria bacterium]NIU03200.1 hypothetical protein [Gammaproteobacteria bacterium]NIV50712.1 hypothetical protein [Gammaproteobacteria bacterium]
MMDGHRTLLALVKPFLDICLLRRNPQDLPASGLLLGLCLLAYAASGMLVSTVMLPAPTAFLAGVTDTVLLCLLTASVLYLQRLRARVPQTLSALAGTGAILSIIALPVTSWLQSARDAGTDTSLPDLMLLALLVWSLVVAGHILRHALSTVFIVGVVLAVLFFWISVNVLYSLFPLDA